MNVTDSRGIGISCPEIGFVKEMPLAEGFVSQVAHKASVSL
jgi:hypothetical protein